MILNIRTFFILAICTCLNAACSSVPVSSGPAQIRLRLENGDQATIIVDKMWGVALRFDGYQEWKDHPLYGKPNLVFAGRSSTQPCELLISMFTEIVPPGATARECREKYTGNPARVRERTDVTLLEYLASPLTYTLFDQRYERPYPGYVQSHLFGYWTRDDICFELHVSSPNCSTFRILAVPILESVRLSPDNGATQETVILARKTGKLPDDWKIHMMAASLYLYSKPSRPDRARRFYMSALDRAGSDLDPKSQWAIQEGIALAWLAEDDGEKALPYLVRALEVNERNYPAPGPRGETLFNLACARALMGETEKACAQLAECLSVQDAAGKERTLERMRSDRQLASVRDCECYRALMATLEKKD